MPAEVSDIKQFIEICRRKDAQCTCPLHGAQSRRPAKKEEENPWSGIRVKTQDLWFPTEHNCCSGYAEMNWTEANV
jgi:hypothetical protein